MTGIEYTAFEEMALEKAFKTLPRVVL